MLGKDWQGVVGTNLSVPETFNFVADVLQPRAEQFPDQIAMICVGSDGVESCWTYRQVLQSVQRIAAALLHRGITQGDRIILFLPRSPLWMLTMAACHLIGVIPVPCVTQISASEVAYRVRRSGARGVVTVAEFTDRFTEVIDQLDLKWCRGQAAGWNDVQEILASDWPIPEPACMPADAPALMYFTSGSSGLPKAVVHAARGVFVRSWQPWHMFDTSSADVIWTTSDTGWTRFGSCLLYGAWFWGATALIVEPNLKPEEKVQALAKYGVTIFSAVSTELRQILTSAKPMALPALKFTVSAGEAMTATLSRDWARFSGVPLLVAYGQTETPQCTITSTDTRPENGMIGRPMPGNVVTAVREDGTPCAPGEHGQLAVRGDNKGLMLGYWQDGVITRDFTDKGWHFTGDAAYVDEGNEIFFLGRTDDIISSSGYRIGPTEVENALLGHPAVRECAVTGAPDALRGEVVKAHIVLEPGFSPSEALIKELQDHVKASIAPYKYPRQVAFLDALPKTPSGKVSRRLLREEPARLSAG